MENLYKFGRPNDPDRPWIYPNVWKTEATSDGNRRLVIAPSSKQVELLIKLFQAMPGPFGILYVLVVPRGENRPGRYQCPEPQTLESVEQFITKFKTFFEADARHNIWIASTISSSFLVYDRHNFIYAYGPSDNWRSLLADEGLREDSTLGIPFPHSHHYHQVLDRDEDRLMAHWGWKYTTLQGHDEE